MRTHTGTSCKGSYKVNVTIRLGNCRHRWRSSLCAIALTAVFFTGCGRSLVDRSIAYSDSCDPAVVNGTAHDIAQVELGTQRVIAIPMNATVRECQPGACTIYVKKHLGVLAHPPERISIVGQRKHMGCATACVGDTLLVATFGEYELPGHGGATIDLEMEIPKGVRIERRTDLAGPKSLANIYFRKRPDDSGAELLAPGNDTNEPCAWRKLRDTPDPAQGHINGM